MSSLLQALASGRAAAIALCAWAALMGLTPAVLAQGAAGVPPGPRPVEQPVVSAAAEDNFVVGSGDIVRVGVFQNPELAVETRVDAAGRMSYPFLGALDVRGKTPGEIERLIATGLEERNVLKQPQVTVNVVQFRSQQVSVLGNVNRPGRFPLDLPYTVSDVVALAGGVAPNGAETVILSRVVNGELTNQAIDLSRMFMPGEKRADDIALLPGDVLYVHRAPMVYIYGEVQRPGPMRLERDMTVLQALSTGGGLTQRGTRRGVSITRKDASGSPVEIGAELSTRLQPDDVVYVQESWF